MCGICNTETGLTSLERKEHAKTHHGYPLCSTCQRVIKNLNMFEKHILEPHPSQKCAMNSCDEQVIVGTEIAHAIERHQYPTCTFCRHTVDQNHLNFYRHVATHQRKPKKCVACDEIVPEWDAEKHATEKHGFPTCPVCDKTINSNFSNFMFHLKSHEVETPCPVCNEMICLEKSILLTHLTETHGFEGVACQKCKMEGFVRMSPVAIIHHLSICYNGKKYSCSTCNQVFKSLYFRKRHNCLSPGGVVEPVIEQLRYRHGRTFVVEHGDLWLELVWDLSGYVDGVQSLTVAQGMTPTPVTSFTETSEEAGVRHNRHGRKYQINEDSRIFREDVNSVPLIYRFMGPPYERGNSLMPHVKLTLVNQFKSLPPADLWVFLMSRLPSFTASARELEALRHFLQVVPLPRGVGAEYRDLRQIWLFSRNIKDMATRASWGVKYACDDLTCRPLIEELASLERAMHGRLNVPVSHNPVEQVTKRRKLVNDEIAADGSMPASEVWCPSNLCVADTDPCVFFDVNAFLTEREAEASTVLSTIDPKTTAAEAGAEAEAEALSSWRERFTVILYLVFRDVVLHFVTTRSLESLRLFSNFFNEEPTWLDLTEMLRAFEPFISQDKATGGGDAVRASSLELKMQHEVLVLTNLYHRGTKTNLTYFEKVKLEKQILRFRELRLHRQKLPRHRILGGHGLLASD